MQWILENYDTILQYVVPGYVTVWGFKFIRHNPHANYNNTAVFIISLMLSRLLTALSDVIVLHGFGINSQMVSLAVACAIGGLAGMLSVKCIESAFVSRCLSRFHRIPSQPTVLRDHFHTEYLNDLTVDVDCGDVIYRGVVQGFGEETIDPWLVMVFVDTYDRNGTFLYSYLDDPECYPRMLIPFSSIKSITINYTDGTPGYPTNWQKQAEELRKTAELPFRPDEE